MFISIKVFANKKERRGRGGRGIEMRQGVNSRECIKQSIPFNGFIYFSQTSVPSLLWLLPVKSRKSPWNVSFWCGQIIILHTYICFCRAIKLCHADVDVCVWSRCNSWIISSFEKVLQIAFYAHIWKHD